MAYCIRNFLQGSINFSISTISSMRSGGDSFGNQMLAAQQNVPIKRLTIPGVGTATEVSFIATGTLMDGNILYLI